MKHKKILFIVSLLIISFLIGLSFVNIVEGNCTNDIPFTFESESYYDSNDPSYNYTLNVRNQTKYTGHYNATYSFENDIIGQTPIGWSNNGLTYQEIENHSKVIGVYGNNKYTKNHFNDDYNSGIIEYWFFTNDSNKRTNLFLFDTTGGILSFQISNGFFQYHNGIDSFYWNGLSNQWYHIKIEWFTYNRANLFCNGILEIDNKTLFSNQTDGFDFFEMKLLDSHYSFLDGIGYPCWDTNYNIAQNMIPIIETNINIKEVDKQEFAFESFQDLNDIDSSNPNGWSEDDPAGNYVKICADTTNDRRIIHIIPSAVSEYKFKTYREFDVSYGIINISWKVELNTWGQSTNEYGIYVYSYDDTELIQVFMKNTQLKYNDGSEHLLTTGLSTNKEYIFNLYINPTDNIVCLRFYEDDIYQDTFYLTLTTYIKYGLGKIEYTHYHFAGSGSNSLLDYIGIYIDGSSLTTEFGIIRNYDIVYITPMLYFTYSNLFNFIIDNTTMSLKLSEYPYVDFNDLITEICPLETYEGFNRFNHYDTTHDGNDYIPTPILWIQFYNQIELSQITIEGVRLTYELYEYGSWLRYTHAGIDTQENYFYENNNKLYFTHKANDTDVLEYIQAEFMLETILTTNRSIMFNSRFSGVAQSIFKVRFQGDTYNEFDFSKGISKYNTILTQKKNFKSFIILITDNNDNNITGNSNGCVFDIELKYYPSIELTILTLSLIEIMIPLIVLIIPTLAIAGIYGKKAIIPMLILMTFICLIGNLIVPEMFFIMMLCLGAGLFLQYKRERDKI